MQKILIDNTCPVQKEFLGINAVSQGFMYMKDIHNREYNDRQIEKELKRIENSGVKILRTYYDQGFAAMYNDDGSVKKDSNGNVLWNYDNSIMQGFYKWLSAMKERKITVVLNLSWGTHILGEKTIFNQNNPFYGMTVDEVTEAYANWATDSIKEIVLKRGFDNVKYGIAFTEPYVRIAISGKRTEGTFSKVTPDTLSQTDWYANYAIPALDNALKLACVRDKIKLIGPNIALRDDVSGSPYTTTLEERVNWWIEKLNSYIDIYSFHWYPPAYPDDKYPDNDIKNQNTYAVQSEFLSRIVPLVSATEKPFWFDEFNYMPVDTGTFPNENAKKGWSGNQLAQILIANMNFGLQNNLVWALNDVQWPLRDWDGREFSDGVHMTGMFPTQKVSDVPYKQFYAYAMLAKAFNCTRPAEIFKGSGGRSVHLTAVKRDDGKTAIAVVNTSDCESEFEMIFQKNIFQTEVCFERILFNPQTVTPNCGCDNLPTDKFVMFTNLSAADTLPAGGVAVYIQK